MPQRRGFSRTERVREQILRELAELVRTDLKDPRVSWVTLTSVDVTRDYAHAKVYYTVLEAEKRVLTQEVLEHAAGHLRSGLSRRISLFNIPQLHFIYDESVERGMSMNKLLDEVARHDDGADKSDDDA